MDRVSKIKQLEQELAMSNEVALRLQRELQEANNKITQQPAIIQKKAPSIGLIGKSQSTDAVCIFFMFCLQIVEIIHISLKIVYFIETESSILNTWWFSRRSSTTTA